MTEGTRVGHDAGSLTRRWFQDVWAEGGELGGGPPHGQ